MIFAFEIEDNAMADPYATIDQAADEVQLAIAGAMEARSTEPAQIRMRQRYLRDANVSKGAKAVDLGSGTGHLARELVEVFECGDVLGLDFSPIMVTRARELHEGVQRLEFRQGDARDTGLPDGSFDLVVLHTVLCHVPGPEKVVAEAFRILKPGGTLAIFDGDYDTSSVALFDNDPLDAVVQWFIRENVHDLWLTRRFAPLVSGAGFEIGKVEGHAYLAEGDAPYFRTVVARGADVMAGGGLMTQETADAVKAEAAARIEQGRFFGFMSFLSLIASKPSQVN